MEINICNSIIINLLIYFIIYVFIILIIIKRIVKSFTIFKLWFSSMLLLMLSIFYTFMSISILTLNEKVKIDCITYYEIQCKPLWKILNFEQIILYFFANVLFFVLINIIVVINYYAIYLYNIINYII